MVSIVRATSAELEYISTGVLPPNAADYLVARPSRESSSATPSPDATVASSSARRSPWTKEEDMRLLCCLLVEHETCEGMTFLQFLRSAPRRQDMNSSRTHVEDRLVEIFNNSERSWRQLYAGITPYEMYNPESLPHLHLPRTREEVMKRFKGDLTTQIKSFASAFKQSGRGTMSEWDFSRFPICGDALSRCSGLPAVDGGQYSAKPERGTFDCLVRARIWRQFGRRS